MPFVNLVMTFLGYSGMAHEGAGCGTVSDMFGCLTLVSSSISFHVHFGLYAWYRGRTQGIFPQDPRMFQTVLGSLAVARSHIMLYLLLTVKTLLELVNFFSFYLQC